MKYYAKITPEKEGGYLVDFPDLPGCFTEGDDLKSAIFNAHEALYVWLETNCEREFNIPYVKVRKGKNYYPIRVPLSVAFSIRLRRLRKKRRLSQAKIAKQLHISQQAYAKLERAQKANPSLSTIQKLANVFGVEVDIKI